MIFKRKKKRDITESFIERFLEEKDVNGVKHARFTYWRMKSSKYDIQELIAFIERYLDDSKFTFDTQKINNLITKNDEK